MTDKTDSQTRARLFYDDTCPMCRRWIARVAPMLSRSGVVALPFEDGAAEPEMRLLWHDGRVFGGADAALFLAGRHWWSWPLFALSRLSPIHALLSAIYRRIAANRHCANGHCALPAPAMSPSLPLWIGWTFTAALSAGAFGIGLLFPRIPGMLWMWLLAGAMWLGFKFIAWSRQSGHVSPLFALWVGMDSAAFARHRPISPEQPARYLPGIVGMVTGIALLAEAAPRVPHPTEAGWLVMAGLVCALHFGLFHLMAGAWQRLGFPVTPIMREPWRAATLAELWGARWNRAFSDIARLAVFRPLVRRFGVAWGTLGGFLVSGLAHELVVSVPARAGYGLPTLYFLIQGLAVLLQRRFPWLGRWFTWLLFLTPASLLFHPAFMKILTPN